MVYENKKVIYGFQKNFAVTFDEASELFNETKRLLWLFNEFNIETGGAGTAVFKMDVSIRILDEMWHTFALFTRDYAEFCLEKFGYFIHHEPDVSESGDEQAPSGKTAQDDAQTKTRLMDEMRPQYIYVHNKLGRECFTRWHFHYKQLYSVKNIMQLRINAYEKKYGSANWDRKHDEASALLMSKAA